MERELVENLSSKLYRAFSPDPGPAVGFLQWLSHSYDLCGRLSVLDVGCGPGQILPEYTRLGWRVTGLEPDKDFYIQATQFAEMMEWVEVRLGGFKDIEDNAAFDLITAINGPFAYLLEPEAQEDALRRVFRALKPGGLLFLDIPNLLWFLKNNPHPPVYKKVVDDQVVWLVQHYYYDLHEAIFTQINEYTLEETNGSKFKFYKTDKHAIITLPYLADCLETSGFVDLRGYSSFASRKADRRAGERIMVSARKPHHSSVSPNG